MNTPSTSTVQIRSTAARNGLVGCGYCRCSGCLGRKLDILRATTRGLDCRRRAGKRLEAMPCNKRWYRRGGSAGATIWNSGTQAHAWNDHHGCARRRHDHRRLAVGSTSGMWVAKPVANATINRPRLGSSRDVVPCCEQ